MKNLFDFILFWINISCKYDRLKAGPKAASSVNLGVTSLIMSILGIFLTVGFAALAYVCFGVSGLPAVLAAICGILCILAALTCFIYLVLASILYAAYQMKLNRHPVGVASLVVSLFSVVATVVAIVVVILVF